MNNLKSKSTKDSMSKVNRLVIIGLGLIGASLALAARERQLASNVIGISRRSSTCELALQAGIIDFAVDNLSDIASELGAGDIVVISVPTLAVDSILQDCYQLLSDWTRTR